MEQNKKDLLFEQINKISEVILTLSENFSQEDVADEINFLSVVRDKLKDWAKNNNETIEMCRFICRMWRSEFGVATGRIYSMVR